MRAELLAEGEAKTPGFEQDPHFSALFFSLASTRYHTQVQAARRALQDGNEPALYQSLCEMETLIKYMEMDPPADMDALMAGYLHLRGQL